jgi:hypothetical protein
MERRRLCSGMLHHVALEKTDIPPKCWFSQEPHGVTSQKTAFFIVSTIKTSNPTNRGKEQRKLHPVVEEVQYCRF